MIQNQIKNIPADDGSSAGVISRGVMSDLEQFYIDVVGKNYLTIEITSIAEGAYLHFIPAVGNVASGDFITAEGGSDTEFTEKITRRINITGLNRVLVKCFGGEVEFFYSVM